MGNELSPSWPREHSTSKSVSAQSVERELEPAEALRDGDARVYSTIAAKLSRPVTRPFAKEALSLGIRSGCALDCGCGPGHLAIHLARYAPGLKVWALDVSPDMVRETSANTATTGLTGRVVPTEGDMRALPFPDDSFDLVTSIFAFHHLPNPGAALREMRRVLKPGGALMVRDFIRPASERRIEIMVRLFGILQWYSEPEREQYRDSLHAGLSREYVEWLAGEDLAVSHSPLLSFFTLTLRARPALFRVPSAKKFTKGGAHVLDALSA
jgi:ubiquinone/menaquinone biosynthesis C-methylase UbiE